MKTPAAPLQTFFTLLLIIAMAHASNLSAASTLDRIKEKRILNCGVHSSLPGFSVKDAGNWQGLEVSFCHAVAAATLGDAARVRFVPLALEKGHAALQSGDLDIVVRHSGMALGTDTALGLMFVEPLYFASQALLVRDDADAYTATDLQGKSVCVDDDQDHNQYLELFMATAGLELKLVSMSSIEAAAKAFEQQRCDAITADLAQLHYLATLLPAELNTRMLPDKIAIRATGPLVRSDDVEWYKIIRWTLALMLSAEQLGIRAESLESIPRDIKGLWDMAGIKGISIGLDPRWHDKVISQVGNYDEVFRRFLGADSPYKMPRGLNAHASDGGLHVAPSLD